MSDSSNRSQNCRCLDRTLQSFAAHFCNKGNNPPFETDSNRVVIGSPLSVSEEGSYFDMKHGTVVVKRLESSQLPERPRHSRIIQVMRVKRTREQLEEGKHSVFSKRRLVVLRQHQPRGFSSSAKAKQRNCFLLQKSVDESIETKTQVVSQNQGKMHNSTKSQNDDRVFHGL